MAYLHCMETGLGQVRGTGSALYKQWVLGSFPCHEPVGTFLYNIFGPIRPGPVPMQCV